MSELIVAREDKEPTELQELILQAGKEAVMLTTVYLAPSRYGDDTLNDEIQNMDDMLNDREAKELTVY